MCFTPTLKEHLLTLALAISASPSFTPLSPYFTLPHLQISYVRDIPHWPRITAITGHSIYLRTVVESPRAPTTTSHSGSSAPSPANAGVQKYAPIAIGACGFLSFPARHSIPLCLPRGPLIQPYRPARPYSAQPSVRPRTKHKKKFHRQHATTPLQKKSGSNMQKRIPSPGIEPGPCRHL